MKWLKVLYVQVLLAITIGLLVGYYFPEFSPTAKLISEAFINLVKMLIAPIIFVTVVLGIAGVGNMKKVGRVGGKGTRKGQRQRTRSGRGCGGNLLALPPLSQHRPHVRRERLLQTSLRVHDVSPRLRVL